MRLPLLEVCFDPSANDEGIPTDMINLVVGMWWHGWDRQTDLDQVAGSLICGHLIECAAYVTGEIVLEQWGLYTH